MKSEKWFWTIIDQSKEGNKKILHEQQIRNLTKVLNSLPPEDIQAFNKTFFDLMKKSHTWELWGAAYTINGGCSDDTFDYFRSWLIGQGESVFYSALDNPEILETVIKPQEDYEWEGLEYCASEVYEQVTGQELNQIPGDTDDEVVFEPKGKKWKEEELPSLYPKLWKKFSRHAHYENKSLKPKAIDASKVCFTYNGSAIPSPQFWIDELKKKGHEAGLRLIGESESHPGKINQENYSGYLLQLKSRMTKDPMGILIKDLSIIKGQVSVEFEIFDKKLKDVFKDLNLLLCEQNMVIIKTGDYELTSDQWKQYLLTGQLNA